MKRTGKKLTALLLTLLCLLPGCGERTQAPVEDELPPVLDNPGGGTPVKEWVPADRVFSLNYDPEAGINPLRADSSANMQFWSLLYDSVFTVDEDFQVSSEVVTAVKSDDYIWWVFDIDDSIPFTDGSTLTAADIVYSIQRAQQSSYYRSRLSCIQGISALSSNCFAITTASAISQFPARLNIPIIKKDSYFDEVPAGSGPYRMAASGDRLELFSENRHAAEMPIDTIYLKDCMDTSDKIRAFESAGLDLVTNDPTGMYNLGYGSNNETRNYDTSNMHFIGFNMNSMFFLTSPARRAVGYVLDRDYVVTELMDGCGVTATLPVHPKSPLYDKEYGDTFFYDPDRAATMFENAGVSDLDLDGELEMLVTGIVVELDIDFIVNNDSSVKLQAARRICEELNALGITTTLRELSWADYLTALEEGDYDMYYGELRLLPDWDLSELFKPREERKEGYPFQGINYGDIRDKHYGELYEAYLAAPDQAGQAVALSEVCRYIGDTGAILPICFERREVLTHRGVVSGIRATQYDIFHNFKDWTIDLE